jgi:hypothetical protein
MYSYIRKGNVNLVKFTIPNYNSLCYNVVIRYTSFFYKIFILKLIDFRCFPPTKAKPVKTGDAKLEGLNLCKA